MDDQNKYEIHGYAVRMTAHQAAAWNDGELSGAILAGARICIADHWVDLWSAIDDDGNDTPLFGEIMGYPANPIS